MDNKIFHHDLHIHSYWSDGDHGEEELIGFANRLNISALVLTDHATIDGWRGFSRLCKKYGIKTFIGAETVAMCDDIWFDVLLYGFNPSDSDLINALMFHKKALIKVCDRYLDWLRESKKLEISWELVRCQFKLPVRTVPSLYYINKYRCNILKMEHEKVGPDIRDARARQIDRRDIYQEHLLHVSDLIRITDQAGGIVSLAHPIKTADVLSRLIKKNKQQCLEKLLKIAIKQKIPAIEVRHPLHNSKDEEKFIAYAMEHSLLITGGSDYHGDRPGGHKVNIHMGSAGVTAQEFSQFKLK